MAQCRSVENESHFSAPTTGLPRTTDLGPGVPAPIAEQYRSTPAGADLVGRIIDEKYKLEAAIGKGGMARVYRAVHIGLHQRVAVKVMHTHLTDDDTAAARFEREAYSASRLKHPNCMQVTDFGRTPDGTLYMVMELLEGRELSKIMGQPASPARAVAIMVQILRGLRHAHEHGVVHRDLKPQNIFLTTDHEGREILKLVDFGLAKILRSDTVDPNFTQYGMIFGTPLYMSPEQAVGSMDVDERADLYSAGIILYQLLAGEPPFQAREAFALLHQHVASPPPPLPRNVPKVLRRVVETLLEKHRDHRFATAGEVLDVLNPRQGVRRPRVPDPVRRRRDMPPSDPSGVELARALERVGANPNLLRVDGTDSVTPVPVPVGPPSTPQGPKIEIAHVRPQNTSRYRVPTRSYNWIFPLLAAVGLSVGWATRRSWWGEVDLPDVSVGGVALRSSHISLGLWLLAGVVAVALYRRARG